ncbi:acyl carrier protein [Dactylosporangium roseum]|uniref:Acyl carrier protein n=1 Tax=Dactylosporangium roseum TaxID=47989 RepID=A0ABY5ZB23_9ACTN|nr:acyl carrier protein [Dactylosporangium roseum]UWZ39290.1 acyl carrier protein [Dactylosporangium roseum]
MPVESRDTVVKEVTRYIQDELLNGDRSAGLTTGTPLLGWGILNSIDTARLVGFIRERFGVRVPPGHIVEKHFKNIECIADLVVALSEAGARTEPARGET